VMPSTASSEIALGRRKRDQGARVRVGATGNY